jgi:TonB-linked SusC/RagA family outer membrane protein
VSGTVRDEAGNALVGVLVGVEGGNATAVTDATGAFTIQAPPQGRLTVSYLGYVDQLIEVSGRTAIDIVCSPDSQVLEDVVVIGYGTQRREAVTGSVASVNAETIQQVQSGNITQALMGRVAGVNMVSVGGGPGSTQKIEIRGVRSLSANNDPLIVLDGIPYPGEINDINPSDIASIDILKDASSTAIYGSRGANGVIMITTNKGTRSRKPTINYDGYVGINTMFSRYPMMNGPEFVEYKKIALENGGTYAAFTGSEDSTGATSTDWQDLVLSNGLAQSHNVSISAPTNGGSYHFGASHYNEDGIMPTQDFWRIGLRGGFDQQVGKRIRVGMTTQNTFSERNGAGMNIMGDLLTMNPTVSPWDENGEVVFNRFALNGTDNNWNPLLILDNNGQRLDKIRAFASYNTMFGEIDIWGGIKYRVNLGANYRQSNQGTFRTGSPGYWSGNALGAPGVSTASVDNRHNFNWSVENLLTFDRSFGKHNINAVAMFSAEQTLYYRSNMSARGITIDQLQFYNLGFNTESIDIPSNNQEYSLRGLVSYMGRIMYSYDNKYMLSAALRSDGASVLAPGHKWHTYPAVSVGWNIARENFMQNAAWLNILKLRVGYGQTSNQSINPYQTYGLMRSSWYTWNGQGVQGYTPNTVGNANLGWEFSETVNVGLDFSVLNGRLSGTVEYYNVKTKDLLMSRRPIPMSGIPGNYTSNVASTKSNGFELTLNGIIFENRNGWNWSAGINLYTNRSEITALSSGSDRDEANMWFVGESINAIYTYKKVGIFQTGEEAVAAASYPNATPGTIKIAYNPDSPNPATFDANGVPSRNIDASDRMIIGSTDANFQGGFNTMVGWKNLDLTVVGTFRQGGLLVSTLHAPNSYLNMLTGRRGQLKVDYWTEENPTNAYPRPGSGSEVGGGNSDNPAYGSTLQFFKNNYMKIRTITLGYNFRGNWLQHAGISNLRLYASVQNPFVLFSPYTKETGLDPETNSYGNENMANQSNALPRRYVTLGYNVPSTRNYIFGLNLTF